mmetsp:Transcript_49572/g.111402  ORF Transcript_49572/g.111402 Transcript_49572/m.111402 type:complete len:578 (+) Transcript_49572:67-1800(+)
MKLLALVWASGLALGAKLRKSSEPATCVDNKFPLDAVGPFHALGLNRGQDLLNSKDLAAFQEGLKVVPDWAVPVAWHLSVTVDSKIKEPLKFGFAGKGGFMMISVPPEARGLVLNVSGRVAAGASDASFQYREGPKVLNGDVTFSNFCLRPRLCAEEDFCGAGWAPKPPKTVGNSRLECCEEIACEDSKEVDGCSGTKWAKKPNFDELKGYTQDHCCQPVACAADLCKGAFKAKNATGLLGSTPEECCEPAYCRDVTCPSETQYTLLALDSDGKVRRGSSVAECCQERRCADLDCGKSLHLAWRNRTGVLALGSTFEECCDKNYCADFTCSPATQWKDKKGPVGQQGGTNEACCAPLLCQHHTCSDPKQTVPKQPNGAPSLALGSLDSECCKPRLCKDYTCSDTTKWSKKPLLEDGQPREGWDDETCCEEIFCENAVDCERADGSKWRSKTPEALIGLQGSTPAQCCDANFCADYTCSTDTDGKGKGTKWYKKVDTNQNRYQGKSDVDCCEPRYCDFYKTKLSETKWKRRKGVALLGSTDAECYEVRRCVDEVNCTGMGVNLTDVLRMGSTKDECCW